MRSCVGINAGHRIGCECICSVIETIEHIVLVEEIDASGQMGGASERGMKLRIELVEGEVILAGGKSGELFWPISIGGGLRLATVLSIFSDSDDAVDTFTAGGMDEFFQLISGEIGRKFRTVFHENGP